MEYSNPDTYLLFCGTGIYEHNLIIYIKGAPWQREADYFSVIKKIMHYYFQ